MKSKLLRTFSFTFVATFILYIAVQSSLAQDAAFPEKARKTFRQRIFSTVPEHVPLKVEIEKNDLDFQLEEAVIKITNTGEKPIYFLSFNLSTLEQIGGNMYGFPSFRYGNVNLGDFSKSEEFFALEREKTEPLKTNESVEFSLTKQQVDGFLSLLRKQGYDRTPKLEFAIYILSFGDGTGYLTRTGLKYPESK